MRRLTIGLAALTIGAVGCGGGRSALEPGTYTGAVHCTGSDRYSHGKAIDRFDSSPRVTVSLGEGGRLNNWTYLFLGRRNKVIQTGAARAGQTFTYAAGAHVGRPGRTKVTVLSSSATGQEARLTASLDWASPSTGYTGAGTYTLRAVAKDGGTVEYHAEKVVVKLSSRKPSAATPVVRRTETCIGDLAR